MNWDLETDMVLTPINHYGVRFQNTNTMTREEMIMTSSSKTHLQIRNVIAKELYGIKRVNHKDKLPPMFFFHELGKAKLQYHTHLLLPTTNIRNNQFNLRLNTGCKT